MSKQIIVVRKDLGLSQGKLSVQVSHASVGAVKKSDNKKVSRWEKEGSKKVAVKVDGKEGLLSVKEEAEKRGLTTFLVKDAGLTELEPGTMTCLGIGPDEDEKIDEVTGSLPLL